MSQLRQQCTDVREQVLNVRVARLGSADGTGPLATDIGKHKDSMRLALGEAYIDRCENKGTRYADCMLGASDHAGIAACDKGTN